MSVETFVQNYGYIAVFLGAFIEGEIIVSIAGALAFQGILSLPYVIGIALCATVLSEQICFYIGRFLGSRYLHRFPTFHNKIEKIFQLLHKYHVAFILSCRFLYGLRILSPFIIGSARIHPLKFTMLNVCAATIWAILSAFIGYGSSYLAKDLGPYVQYIFIGITIIVTTSMLPLLIKKVIKEA